MTSACTLNGSENAKNDDHPAVVNVNVDVNVYVNLLDLAASALASTVSASRPIRERSAIGGHHHQKDKNARLKLDGTVVTDADGEAQGIIVRALTKTSKQIRIVGEESPQEMERHFPKPYESDKQSQRIFHCAKKEVYMRYHHSRSRKDDDNNNDDDDDTHHSVTPALAETTDSCGSGEDQDDEEDQDQDVFDGQEETNHQHPYLVDPSRVSVYVDPLDGTKCYANGQYDSVTILITIILDNTPCFGVICKPFGSKGIPSILDTGCAAVYGGQLLGGVFIAGGSQWHRQPLPSKQHQDEAETNDPVLPKAILSLPEKSTGGVRDFIDHLAAKGMVHPDPIHASGAGQKSMRLVLGLDNEGLWFWPKKGTSRWDVAASDALLRSMGGRLTDKYGDDLDYSTGRTRAENENGIIACSDTEMHQECIRMFREENWDDKIK